MKDLVDIFQSFRKILCICPCCGEIVRLSDLHLKYSGKAPKTWLDEYELDATSLEKKEQLFEEEEWKVREKSIERGRKKVPLMVKQCLCPEFGRLEYDPYDIKAVMDPVDFVVFDGLNEGQEIRSITFLSRANQHQTKMLLFRQLRKRLAKVNMTGKLPE